MNQSYKRSSADFMKFVPFETSGTTSVVINSSIAGTTSAWSRTGNTIDLTEYVGCETLVLACAARSLSASSNLASSEDPVVSGYFVTDTSSAFGGSTTLGSTFTLTLKPSSAQSSEEGVMVASVNLNTAGAHRYVRGVLVVEASSGDGDLLVLSPIYVLSGRDGNPSTHNVQIGGAVTT
jgi:hypothetical protein